MVGQERNVEKSRNVEKINRNPLSRDIYQIGYKEFSIKSKISGFCERKM